MSGPDQALRPIAPRFHCQRQWGSELPVAACSRRCCEESCAAMPSDSFHSRTDLRNETPSDTSPGRDPPHQLDFASAAWPRHIGYRCGARRLRPSVCPPLAQKTSYIRIRRANIRHNTRTHPIIPATQGMVHGLSGLSKGPSLSPGQPADVPLGWRTPNQY